MLCWSLQTFEAARFTNKVSISAPSVSCVLAEKMHCSSDYGCHLRECGVKYSLSYEEVAVEILYC